MEQLWQNESRETEGRTEIEKGINKSKGESQTLTKDNKPKSERNEPEKQEAKHKETNYMEIHKQQ